ncbi:cupin domain-containing protein [Chloroflexota bacterium]
MLRPSEIPAEVQHRGLFIGESSMQPLINKGTSKNFWSCLRHWEPKTRAKFHSHSSDQILIVTEGSGIITTDKEQISVGIHDIILIPAEEKHWHGATEDSPFTYVQIQAQDSVTTQLEE